MFDPASGAVLRSWSQPAHGEEQILPALDAIASNIRRDLGESRLDIQENHRPLPQVTTASLQALQDYVDDRNLPLLMKTRRLGDQLAAKQ